MVDVASLVSVSQKGGCIRLAVLAEDGAHSVYHPLSWQVKTPAACRPSQGTIMLTSSSSLRQAQTPDERAVADPAPSKC